MYFSINKFIYVNSEPLYMSVCPNLRPLLIYDDKCSVCTNFAKTVSKLSKGWIQIAGHYYSKESIELKKMIFPPHYDSTKMFWLINNKGAFGARCGIVQVMKEIIVANFKFRKNECNFNEKSNNKNKDTPNACPYSEQISCMSKKNTIRRITNTLRKCEIFKFPQDISK